MTEKVKYETAVACATTGELYSIEDGLMDADLYINSSENKLKNLLLIKLLEKYPEINLGVDMEFAFETTFVTMLARCDEQD